MFEFSWPNAKSDNEVFILIKAKPNAKKTTIAGIVDIQTIYPVKKALQINIQAQAEDNKANLELISFVAEVLKLPKNKIEITNGHKNKIKVLKIIGGNLNLLTI